MTVDPDEAFTFDLLELGDHFLGGNPGRAGHHLDGGRSVACHRQQDVADGLVEAADPGTHQLGERHRHGHVRVSLPPSIARANSSA